MKCEGPQNWFRNNRFFRFVRWVFLLCLFYQYRPIFLLNYGAIFFDSLVKGERVQGRSWLRLSNPYVASSLDSDWFLLMIFNRSGCNRSILLSSESVKLLLKKRPEFLMRYCVMPCTNTDRGRVGSWCHQYHLCMLHKDTKYSKVH